MKNQRELLEELQRQVKNAGGQAAWARAHDVNQGQVSSVLRGLKPVSPSFAAKMGYKMVFVRTKRLESAGGPEDVHPNSEMSAQGSSKSAGKAA